MPDLVAEPLLASQVRLAFPLMRQVVPALTLKDWVRFAQRIVAPRGAAGRGILVVRRRGSPHLCGVVCYRRDHDVLHGAVLTAEHFAALDLLYPQAILAALVAALDARAAALGCVAVRSVVPVGRRRVAQDLRACGYGAEGVVMARSQPALPL